MPYRMDGTPMDAINELQISFRQAMADVATPVSIVTSFRDGVPHGTTVSAFNSLSMQPPMLLVALDQSSALLEMIKGTGRFAVNVLSEKQSPLASVFATKTGTMKFSNVTWELEMGLPMLPDCIAWIACELDRLVDGGDHIVVLGCVAAVRKSTGRPLTYHARSFGTHRPLGLAI